MIKYGIIGTGWITKAFINSTMQIDGIELSAVYSRKQETADAFAQEFGVTKIFTDLEEMAKSDSLDAVYIASPNKFHYQHAKLFLENGKHVICEKPIAVSGALVRELTQIANRNKVVFIEAIKSMFTPGAEIIKSALDKIGIISQANFSFLQLSSKYPALKNGEIPNIFNPQLETGAVMDIGVYCLYPAVYLFGDCDNINSSAVLHQNGIDLCGDTVLSYGDKSVTVSYSKIGNQRIYSQIVGDKGTILIEKISNMAGITLIDNDNNEQELYPYDTDELYMKYEADFFKNAINNYEQYKDRLSYLNSISATVCDKLKIIREKQNMTF